MSELLNPELELPKRYTLVTDRGIINQLPADQQPDEWEGAYLVTDYRQQYPGQHLSDAEAREWMHNRATALGLNAAEF